MQIRGSRRPHAIALAVAATLCTNAFAATLGWDAGVTTAAGGGSTVSEATEWKTSAADNVWWDGTNNVAWANANDANFAGTPGTVYLGSTISGGVASIATGYTIDLRDYNAGSATSAAAYNLSLTGLTGAGGTIRNTSSTTAATLTINLANDTTWGGVIGAGGDRLAVTISGGKTLSVAGAGRNAGSGQLSLTVSGAGTRLNIGGTTSTHAGNNLVVQSGATLDVGANNFVARSINLAAGNTITSTAGGTIGVNTQFGAPDLAGALTGNLKVEFTGATGGTGTKISGSSNTFTGGLVFSNGNVSGVTDLTVTTDNGLSTGPVSMNNFSANNDSSIHTARIIFQSANPTIGSLSSSNKGAKSIVLGKAATNSTNLSIGTLNTNTTFAGVISEAEAGSGISKVGSGTFTLAGAASYTGTTRVTAGTLVVTSGAAQTGVNSVNTTLNNNLITYGVGQLPSGLGVGQSITGTNIAAGATIIAVDVTNRRVYMSAGATATGTSTPSFGAWQSLGAASDVEMAGGTLSLGGLSQSVDKLLLSDNSTIDFGAGSSILSFTGLGAFDTTKTLQLLNWSGLETGNGADQLYVGNAAFLSPAQLGSIKFVNPAGFDAGTYGATQLASGEIVVVPEPASVAVLVLGGLVMRRRRH